MGAGVGVGVGVGGFVGRGVSVGSSVGEGDGVAVGVAEGDSEMRAVGVEKGSVGITRGVGVDVVPWTPLATSVVVGVDQVLMRKNATTKRTVHTAVQNVTSRIRS